MYLHVKLIYLILHNFYRARNTRGSISRSQNLSVFWNFQHRFLDYPQMFFEKGLLFYSCYELYYPDKHFFYLVFFQLEQLLIAIILYQLHEACYFDNIQFNVMICQNEDFHVLSLGKQDSASRHHQGELQRAEGYLDIIHVLTINQVSARYTSAHL